jgi:alkylmercury lyase
VLLERPVVIRSRDHATGEPIHVETGPEGKATVEPRGAVMSWVGPTHPDQFTTMRATFCHHIHFFPSLESAAGWSAKHPGGSVLSVSDAFQAARRLADIFPDPAGSRGAA